MAQIQSTKTRDTALDALRGLVMIIMALDHVRDFFHAEAFKFQPDDLTKTTAAIFFTRWITHICAPVFMFSAGAGAFLWMRNGGHSAAELSKFLWSRGLWLVLLELTVLRLIFNLGFTNGPILLTVLWALGWSMVALGFLSRLPVRVLAVVSVLTIALHNLADPVRVGDRGAAAWVWHVLHQLGVVMAGDIVVVVAYPLIPWIAVMAAGYCFGRILILDPAARQKWLWRIGFALTTAFVVVRAVNVYGDPQPWTSGLLSFLRTTKYPPSLDFLLMTLGPATLILAWFYRVEIARSNILVTIGRVPLLYFLGHMFIARVLTILFALVRYGHAGFLVNSMPGAGDGFPADYGYSLGVVYLVWIAVVALMYPVCLWYGRLKSRNRSWWLSYL
jgi:uncharacterized membrane protein